MTAKLERGTPRTKRVELGDGDYVVIKKLTAYDRSLINGAVVTGKITIGGTGKPGEPNAQQMEAGTLNVGASAIQTLIQGVVAWGGPAFCVEDHDDPDIRLEADHQHTPLPVTPELLQGMFDEYSEKIVAAIDQWSPNPTLARSGQPS